MSDSSIIKEFLVALGFKTDESALKNFELGISKATKAVVGLATAIETTAVGVAAGVAKFASNLEALYFASIRTGSSVTSLLAFDKAAQDFGATAGEARASIEGLARALRMNPGNEGVLKSLGIQTRDAKGALRDTESMMLDLAKGSRLVTESLFVAEQHAAMLGISENTLLAMRNGDFAGDVDKKAKEYGPNWQKTAEDAHAFMEQMRDLQVVLEAFGAQVYQALVKRLGGDLGSATKWLQTNGPKLAEQIAAVMLKVIDFAERVGKAVVWLIDKFIEWDAATHGVSTKLLAGLAVLKFFGGAEIIGGIFKLTAAFLKLGIGIARAGSSGAGLLGLLSRLGLVAGAGAVGYGVLGPLAKGGIDKLVQHYSGDKNASLGTWLYDITHRGQQALEFFQNRGWSADQSAGFVANINAESGMRAGAEGDHGKAYGLLQWHPDRQANFKKWAGKDIRESSYEEQLAFIDYEAREGSEQAAGRMIRAAKNARQAGEFVSRYLVRPRDVEGEAAKRGESAMNFQAHTEIHVHGDKDPHQTARVVKREQDRAAADQARTFIAVVQ